MLVDLHCHSNYSDGAASVAAIEEHCRRHGIGLALSDHNEIRGSIQLVERQRVPCIPAIEVGTREGLEFLVYFARPEQLEAFYRKAVEPFLYNRFMVRSRVRTEDCLEAAAEHAAFVSLAHPYALGRKSIGKHWHATRGQSDFGTGVLSAVQAIELFNGGIPKFSNKRASELLGSVDKLITVGSDAHTLAHIGSAGLILPSALPAEAGEELFDLLAANDHVDLKAGFYSSKFRTLHIIATRHTAYFFKTRHRKNPTGAKPRQKRLTASSAVTESRE